MPRTALWMTSTTASGCDTSTACEASISTVREGAARFAWKRVFAVPIVLSWVATSAHDGIVFQAGGPETSVNAASASGRWAAASNAVFSGEDRQRRSCGRVQR